jgi:hypothetical protein
MLDSIPGGLSSPPASPSVHTSFISDGLGVDIFWTGVTAKPIYNHLSSKRPFAGFSVLFRLS